MSVFSLIEKDFKIAEAILYKKEYNKNVVTKLDIDSHIEKVGFISHRSHILSFLRLFSKASGNIEHWVTNVNLVLKNINWKLSILHEAKQFQIENLFSIIEKEIPILGYSAGTVHSVKGETYDGYCFFKNERYR